MFVNEPSTDFLCLICLKVINNLRQCINGHCFCKDCISAYVDHTHECPVCKTHLTRELLGKSVFVQSMINDMTVVCPSTKSEAFDGGSRCEWTGKLCNRLSHFDECSKRVHFLECDHCELSFNAKDLQEHEMICELRPVYCTNKCDLVVAFNQLESHKQRDCPLHTVDCPIFRLGLCEKECPGQLIRRDLKVHIAGADSLPTTVIRLAELAVVQQTRINTLETKLNALADIRVDASVVRTTNQEDGVVCSSNQSVSTESLTPVNLPSQLGCAVTTYPLPSERYLNDVACVGKPLTKYKATSVSMLQERKNAKQRAARELATTY